MPTTPPLHSLLDFAPQGGYRRLDLPHPRKEGSLLRLEAGTLEALAREAFREIAFLLPTRQLEGFAAVLADPAASEPERFVAASLLRNAAVAAEGVHPLCQDTGSAIVYGWRGEEILGKALGPGRPGLADEEALEAGRARAWKDSRLRASTLLPGPGLGESNPGGNGPLLAQIASVPGRDYRLCFAAKGGGSANRTSLSMEAPSLLDGQALEKRLAALVKGLGVSGCPPYRITCVLGGLSPEESLHALALAGLGLLDGLGPEPKTGSHNFSAWARSPELEGLLSRLAASSGLGAQFGGSHLALDTRAFRLPRHAASLPLACGVACAAARSTRARIDEEGVWLEVLETDPGRFLPKEEVLLEGAVKVDLDRPLSELAAQLGRLDAGTPLLLSGKVVTARDRAHARFAALVREGRALPDYLYRHPVFYAGPTEAAPGQVSGSFGPTTAGRMDAFLPALLELGASLVSIAKGGRSGPVAEALGRAGAKGGAAYLCAIGGAAALTGRDHILSSTIIDHADLGMEAVRLVEIRDLPAIVGINGRGEDFYSRAKP